MDIQFLACMGLYLVAFFVGMLSYLSTPDYSRLNAFGLAKQVKSRSNNIQGAVLLAIIASVLLYVKGA